MTSNAISFLQDQGVFFELEVFEVETQSELHLGRRGSVFFSSSIALYWYQKWNNFQIVFRDAVFGDVDREDWQSSLLPFLRVLRQDCSFNPGQEQCLRWLTQNLCMMLWSQTYCWTERSSWNPWGSLLGRCIGLPVHECRQTSLPRAIWTSSMVLWGKSFELLALGKKKNLSRGSWIHPPKIDPIQLCWKWKADLKQRICSKTSDRSTELWGAVSVLPPLIDALTCRLL